MTIARGMFFAIGVAALLYTSRPGDEYVLALHSPMFGLQPLELLVRLAKL